MELLKGQWPWLRGVNVNALIHYGADDRENVPLGPDDFPAMQALGLQLLRLPLSLSALMPQPGHIDDAYLEQIRAVLDAAQPYGIGVVLDLHQDRYASFLYPDGEADGFPKWAAKSWGLPLRPKLLGETNLAVQAAFTSFWLNAPVGSAPLWTHYRRGLLVLVERFRSHPALLGYDLMNEPNPGFLLGGRFTRRRLVPFYQQLVAAVRQLDAEHLLLLEPDLLRDGTWPPVRAWRAFSGMQRLCYEPHMYQGVFVPNWMRRWPFSALANCPGLRRRYSPYLPWNGRLSGLRPAYQAARQTADLMGAQVLVGEFGAPNDALGDRFCQAQLTMALTEHVPICYWLWKIAPGHYDWGVLTPDGGLTHGGERARILSAPHPLRLDGQVLHLLSESTPARLWVVWLPGQLGEATFYLSHLSFVGGPEVVRAPTGTRIITHHVRVAGVQLDYSVLMVPERGSGAHELLVCAKNVGHAS